VHCKGEVCRLIFRDVLDDHVDFDVGVGNRSQDTVGNPGLIRNPQDRQFGLIAAECDTRYFGLLHIIILKGDQGAFTFLKTGKNTQWDTILPGKLHCSNLKNL